MNKIVKKILSNSSTDMYIVFYSKWCDYSVKSINMLVDNKKSFKAYNIENIGDFNSILQYFIKYKSLLKFDETHKTRPIIFKNGKFMGGYQCLQHHLNQSNSR